MNSSSSIPPTLSTLHIASAAVKVKGRRGIRHAHTRVAQTLRAIHADMLARIGTPYAVPLLPVDSWTAAAAPPPWVLQVTSNSLSIGGESDRAHVVCDQPFVWQLVSRDTWRRVSDARGMQVSVIPIQTPMHARKVSQHFSYTQTWMHESAASCQIPNLLSELVRGAQPLCGIYFLVNADGRKFWSVPIPLFTARPTQSKTVCEAAQECDALAAMLILTQQR